MFGEQKYEYYKKQLDNYTEILNTVNLFWDIGENEFNDQEKIRNIKLDNIIKDGYDNNSVLKLNVETIMDYRKIMKDIIDSAVFNGSIVDLIMRKICENGLENEFHAPTNMSSYGKACWIVSLKIELEKKVQMVKAKVGVYETTRKK